MALSLSLCLMSTNVFADRQEFNQPSQEVKNAIATAATNLGYDLSTQEGRKSFGDYLKSQRDSLAKSANIDLSTVEGRKKFGDQMKAKVDEIAKAQGFDMSTNEGRDSMEKYLASTGNLAYLRPEPKDHGGNQNNQGNANANGRQKRPDQNQGGQDQSQTQSQGQTQVGQQDRGMMPSMSQNQQQGNQQNNQQRPPLPQRH